MIAKFLDWVDRQNISIGEWLSSMIAVVFVRCMIEAFSNPSSSGIVASDASTLVHYWLFYTAVVFGISCIISLVAGHPLRVGKLLLLGLPLIWLGPLLDIIISGGSGYKILYLLAAPLHMGVYFFVYLLPHSIVTPGLRIELSLIIFIACFYVWYVRRSSLAAFGAGFLVYSFIFVIFACPSIIYLFSHLDDVSNVVSSKAVVNYLYEALDTSIIGRNSLHATLLFSTPGRALEIEFNYLMSQITFLLSCFFLAFWLHKTSPQIFSAIIKNCRIERIGFYLIVIFLGIAFAVQRGLMTHFSWIDGMGIVTLAIAWACSWMFAVHVNDIADIKIDMISNANRPLVRGVVSVRDMQQIGYLWLAAALLGTWSVGYYPFYFNLIFTAVGYVYSAPPLRLRRIPILASALIALAALCAFMAGFFLVSTNKKFDVFPISLALGIMVIFTLGVNVRDIKDIAGDKADNVKTLPVLLGKYGVHAVAAMFAAGFILVPIILKQPVLYFIAIPAALLGYALTIKKPYEEKWLFILYFAFILLGIIITNLLP